MEHYFRSTCLAVVAVALAGTLAADGKGAAGMAVATRSDVAVRPRTSVVSTSSPTPTQAVKSVAAATSATQTLMPSPSPVTSVKSKPAVPTAAPSKRVSAGDKTPHPVGCSAVLMIGVRGSGEGPQGTNAANPAAYGASGAQNWGRELAGVWSGLRQASSGSTESVNLVYPAVNVNQINSLSNYDTNGYSASVAAGVSELKSFLPVQEALCPGQRLVLAGYSQGAMVLHDALVSLAAASPSVISTGHVSAVLLVADPARVPNARGVNVGSAVAASYGIGPALTYGGTYTGCLSYLPALPCTQGVSIKSMGFKDLPTGLAGVSASLCDAGDIVCATDPAHLNDGFAIHTSYSSEALSAFGARGSAR